MFMAMLPFIGVFFRKIHVWYHSKINHKEHKAKGPVIKYIKLGPMRDVVDILKNPPKFNPPPVLFDELQKATAEVQDACQEMIERCSAFDMQKGAEAYACGKFQSCNPYPYGTAPYSNWSEGWEFASKVDREKEDDGDWS